MKRAVYLLFSIFIFIGCTSKKSPTNLTETSVTKEAADYFPVTNFIKGQILEIRSSGINPLKYTTKGEKKDSVWLKTTELETEMASFLHPEIDTVNMVNLFTETKFLDQSINAFTFTYDPAKQLADTMQLQHWDVYINPDDGKVKRIYLVKKINKYTQQQLTWIADNSCKIVTIENKTDGRSFIQEEISIVWKF